MAIKCPKCQFENPNTAKFCSDCAAPLQSSKDVSVTKTLQTLAKGFKKDTVIAKKYKISEKLGEGGMGVVYKAKDMRLDRTVALKFLPPELTKDEQAKQRFVQEAKAAAALEHPNICTVYEVDEADGQTFIAMSYIEGQSLKDKLQDGPMDVDEAKDIALQVAEGLKEAHDKGIVHRDIKPANIMLTKKGQAKITDFGLAKLSWAADLTKTPTIMGTVAYMSPEQARGEEVDHRTDIWSLGAMLYEMLTGERPFKKDQEQALIYSILNDSPTPLSLLRSDIPTHIEQVIEKALAKKAIERYQDIKELIQDLKLSISFPKAEKSIVVLPFENLSPDLEQEYFCDGMTEEITSDLSKIGSLRVISRNSAMMFKETRKSTKTIGKELDVQYVLEGSVRKAGNNLRITAQLIEAANDAHLWTDKYSGNLDDVFEIQEKVSRAIVEALEVELTPQENRKISEHRTDNVQAYECYLRAYREMQRMTEPGIKRALKDLHNGLEIVGENALLYFGLGEAYLYLKEFFVETDEDPLKKAEEYASKVYELEPGSSNAHYLLGMIEKWRGNVIKAIRHFERALALKPDSPNTLFWLSLYYAFNAGQASNGLRLAKMLVDIDPLTPGTYLVLGFAQWMGGQLDSALESLKKHSQLDPDSIPRFFNVYVLMWRNQSQQAFERIDQLIGEESSGRIPSWTAELLLFSKYAFEKNKELAFKTFNESTRLLCWDDPVLPWLVAGLYSVMDEKEEALRWLEHTIDRGWINYPLLSEQDPFLENIRSEPRFKKLMERVKHQWENFEV